MDRRSSPRQGVRGTSLKATLVLSGGSLLYPEIRHFVEIAADPIDLSRSGIGLSLSLDAPWTTIAPSRTVGISLRKGDESCSLNGTVVRYEEENRTVGMKFADPIDLSRFLVPEELQNR